MRYYVFINKKYISKINLGIYISLVFNQKKSKEFTLYSSKLEIIKKNHLFFPFSFPFSLPRFSLLLPWLLLL